MPATKKKTDDEPQIMFPTQPLNAELARRFNSAIPAQRAEAERAIIAAAVEHHGNLQAMARALGTTPDTIRRYRARSELIHAAIQREVIARVRAKGER